MSEIITVRDIGTVTTEILMIRQQVNQVALNGAIEIGRRLVEAKEILPHGEWGRWLQEEVDFSQRTANNFMQLFEEYGAEQITIFGAVANSQSIANLPYTKALKLLAIPAEEREAFAEEVKAAEISTRELDAAIRERNAAREALDGAMGKIRDAETAAASSKARADAAELQAEDLRLKLDKAKKKETQARQELKKLRENPEIPEDTLAKLRQEAKETAAKTAAEAAEQRCAELIQAKEQAEARASAAAKEAKAAQERLDAARKQIALANPNAAVFAALLSQFQEDWNKLHGCFLKIRTADPELSEKLKKAVAAQIGIYAGENW